MKEKIKDVFKEYFKLAVYIFVSFCVLCISIGLDEKELLKAFDIFENTFSMKSLTILVLVILVIIGLISSVKSLTNSNDSDKFVDRIIVFFLEILINTFYSFVVGICAFYLFYSAFCIYKQLNISSSFLFLFNISFYLLGGAEAIFFKKLIDKKKIIFKE